jgi:8-oxo-dGTP pyrophosphatase MutT (NUDIX family)
MDCFELLRRIIDETALDEPALAGDPRYAAVCVLVARVEGIPSICFIRRAKWNGDPWSEHIALPGGSRNGDEEAAQTLRREVEEEIGVAIPSDSELTPLPRLKIRLAGRERLLLLDSFVHHWPGPAPDLLCSPEVESAFWIQLAELWSIRNLDHLVLDDDEDTLVYPAIRVPQGTIFGITLRVLMLLSDRLGIPLQYLEEIPLLRRKRT